MWFRAVVFLTIFLACLGNVASIFGFGSSKDKETTTEGPYIDAVTELDTPIQKAVSWLLSKQTDYDWGEDTTRAIIAIALSNYNKIKDDERELMKKQLSLRILRDLIRDRRLNSLPLPRLALYINALLASCHDPRSFHGQDLVKILRSKRSKIDKASAISPVIVLSFCLAHRFSNEDMSTLYLTVHSRLRNSQGDPLHNERVAKRADLEAYTAMASACMLQSIDPENPVPSFFIKALNSSLRDYLDNPKEKGDVYTLSLLLQAVNAWSTNTDKFSNYDRNELKDLLLTFQMEDGSFGDLLATYYAIPALTGKSLLDLQKVNCSRPTEKMAPLLDSPVSTGELINVSISLWITKEDDVENHTSKFAVRRNSSLHDILKLAARKNSLFKFETYDTKQGKTIYKISGIANDVERKMYWILYPNTSSMTAKYATSAPRAITGINKIFARNNGSFVFWYKPH